jgi:hypothetical protein
MNRRALDSLTTAIAFSAAIAVSASYAFGGLRVGAGALAGGAVALGNWVFVRWLLSRIAAGNALTQAGLMTLLAAKLGALGVVVWILIGLLGLHAGGFGIGLGALVIGILFGVVNQADALVGLERGDIALESIDSARKEH